MDFKQGEMPFMSVLKDKVNAPSHLVASCRDYTDSIRLCMSLSNPKRNERAWAELLEMSPGNLSAVLNSRFSKRKRFMNPDLYPVIEDLAGNRAISQFFEMQSKGMLNSQSKQVEIHALEARLTELRARESL